MAIVEVHCLESDCGQAKANKGHDHHDYGSSMRDIMILCVRNVLLRGLEHTLSVTWLLYVLLADGISHILKHLHLHSAILLFTCTLTSSAAMADTAVGFVNIIQSEPSSLVLIILLINVVELIITSASWGHTRCSL